MPFTALELLRHAEQQAIDIRLDAARGLQQPPVRDHLGRPAADFL